MAHRGVLFLDELMEYPRSILEVLRQPLEDGIITISRAQQSITYPAKTMLITAMNPCPCGYLGDSLKTCSDSDVAIQRYIGRLSGPILDRIDMHLEVPRLSPQELLNTHNQAESSADIRLRVIAARDRQLARFQNEGIFANAEMSPHQIKQYCQLDAQGLAIMSKAMQRLHLSARGFDRILRLGRTIADLAQSEQIQAAHLAEALQFRALDKLSKTIQAANDNVSRLPQSHQTPNQQPISTARLA